MKFFKVQPEERLRYLPALLAGACLGASFPKLGMAGLAWLAPGLMLGAALGLKGGSAFRIGYVAGLTHYCISLYWLLLIPVTFAPIVGWLLLSAYASFYPALWVWLCWRIYPGRLIEGGRLGPNDPQTGVGADKSKPFVSPALLGVCARFLNISWTLRLGWGLCCAAIWVALEMVLGRLFTGFPWNFLGASQYQVLPLIQVSAWTGIYGVSFLLVWFSVGILAAGICIMQRQTAVWLWAREFLGPLVVIALLSGFGLHRVLTAPAPSAKLKVLLVQPSIPQKVIWDEKESATRFRELVELTEQGLTNQPDLLIWPEAAVPGLLRWDTNVIYDTVTAYEVVTNLVQKYGVWLIMGADDAEPRAGAPGGADFFNNSFLMSPKGSLAASYHKQKLVIFGEYVPLSKWFPFLMDFAHVYGAFTPGKGPAPFKIPGLRVKISVLICFEDVFPHVARHYVEDDTDFLVNLTNDGWFGEGAAQWQQAATAVFRAVENGIPLVRDTNNGLTCWVDACGGLHEVHYPGFKNIYQAGCKLAYIPILGGEKRSPTFYNRHGDWFGWGCVALAGALLLSAFYANRES